MSTRPDRVPLTYWDFTDSKIERGINKSKFWGLREQEIHILLLIAYWYNGHPLTIRDEQRHIATHHELPLKDMFRGTSWIYAEHEDAHEVPALRREVLPHEEEGVFVLWLREVREATGLRVAVEGWRVSSLVLDRVSGLSTVRLP